jgi:hypothetical protein
VKLPVSKPQFWTRLPEIPPQVDDVPVVTLSMRLVATLPPLVTRTRYRVPVDAPLEMLIVSELWKPLVENPDTARVASALPPELVEKLNPVIPDGLLPFRVTVNDVPVCPLVGLIEFTVTPPDVVTVTDRVVINVTLPAKFKTIARGPTEVPEVTDRFPYTCADVAVVVMVIPLSVVPSGFWKVMPVTDPRP